ncbi:MAG TPA: hypothetical protein VHZ25_16535 [Acidobacteriaceae bacterium]|jgi:hypothetical protein|nr:hypothetical protein [Acidobacteriaceae bacterium]
MGARENLQRLYDKKSQEIQDLERQIERAKVYSQAIQDSIKALPRETTSGARSEDGSSDLRPGTRLARAKEAIRKNGAAMHINELLEAIGAENTKEARVSLVGSLGSYVRKGQVFTRPLPNTFGLIGMATPNAGENLPVSFGKLSDDV